MPDATPPAGFGRPDLITFARLDGLGLAVIGQRLEPDRVVLACRVVEPDRWCRACGAEGLARDTVIIDLTPVRDGTGPARLLDMVQGRSKQAFKTWLANRPDAWRDAVKVVAMDGFTGFKTAAAEEVPDAVAVMDPFPSCGWPGMRWTSVDAGCSWRSTATALPGRPAIQVPSHPAHRR